jgi:quercetin dioxygenase-like cupin family protein
MDSVSLDRSYQTTRAIPGIGAFPKTQEKFPSRAAQVTARVLWRSSLQPQDPLLRRWRTLRAAPIIGGMKTLIIAIALGMVTAQSWSADVAMTKDQPGIYLASDVQWKDGPLSLPAGAKIAVLEGDPTKDGFFTMRLLFPDGYKIPPHTHPKVEHVTVISGTFNLGMGDTFDALNGHEMPAGTFGFWPAGMKHFAWTKGATTIQLHGIGPWTINYVRPEDDPRNAKK